MNAAIRWSLILMCAFNPLSSERSRAQEADAPKVKDKNAYLTIVNCCETSMPERWRAALDIKNGADWFAQDLRIGESTTYRTFEVKEGNVATVYLHGEPQTPLLSIPANLEAGAFYTLVLTGNLSASGSKVVANLIKEYPLAGAAFQGTRLVIFNAVGTFPIDVVIPGVLNQTLTANSKVEKTVSVGSLPIEMWFPYKDGEKRKITAGLNAEAGASYTLVVYSSQERPDRPALFRTNATALRQELDAQRKEAAESKSAPAPTP